MAGVVIGMDPYKRSATIEVCDEREHVLATGRFGTDRDGYRQLLAAGRWWPDRLWAAEGCAGVGRHLARRLVADGEPVVDVPMPSCRPLTREPGCLHRAGPQDRRPKPL